MSYWVIAVPADKNSRQRGKAQLAHACAPVTTATAEWQIPMLKVGTLDLLMSLSDELTKSDQQLGLVVKKIQRAYMEVVKTRPKSADEIKEEKQSSSRRGKKEEATVPALTVNDKHPQDYLQTFEFNQRRYPPASSLLDMMQSAMKQAYTDDDHLKTLMASYNEVRMSVEATERKEQGSLMVKPLSQLVKEKDLLETDHVTTVLLVVPKKSETLFLGGYETLEEKYRLLKKATRVLREEGEAKREKKEIEVKKEEGGEEKVAEERKETDQQIQARETKEAEEADKEARRARMARLPQCDNVIPRSATKLAEDDEFILFSILVFKKGVENFKSICRQERYTVRPYTYVANEEKSAQETKKKLMKKRAKMFSNLVQWTKTMFSLHFIAWIHLKVMRVFVEAVLRYGLPIDIQCFCIQPKKNMDPKVRKALEGLYSHLAHPEMTSTDSGEEVGALESQFGEFFPYVSLDFNLSLDNP